MTKLELYSTLYKAKSGHSPEVGQIEALLASAEAKDYASLSAQLNDKGARFIFWLHTRTPLDGTPHEAACKLADYCGVPRPERPAEPEKPIRQRRQKAVHFQAQYKGVVYDNYQDILTALLRDHNCEPVEQFNHYKQRNEYRIKYRDYFKTNLYETIQCAPDTPGAQVQYVNLASTSYWNDWVVSNRGLV